MSSGLLFLYVDGKESTRQIGIRCCQFSFQRLMCRAWASIGWIGKRGWNLSIRIRGLITVSIMPLCTQLFNFRLTLHFWVRSWCSRIVLPTLLILVLVDVLFILDLLVVFGVCPHGRSADWLGDYQDNPSKDKERRKNLEILSNLIDSNRAYGDFYEQKGLLPPWKTHNVPIVLAEQIYFPQYLQLYYLGVASIGRGFSLLELLLGHWS